MTSDHTPPDALFIRWGKFQAGALGRLAIVALLAIMAAIVYVLWLQAAP